MLGLLFVSLLLLLCIRLSTLAFGFRSQRQIFLSDVNILPEKEINNV